MSGKAPELVAEDIRQAIPDGSRKVSDREIEVAVRKAAGDVNLGAFASRSKVEPVIRDGQATLRRLIQHSPINDEYELLESSPIRLNDDPAEDARTFMDQLFWPGELIFTGERYDRGVLGRTIRTRTEWCERYTQGEKPAPFLIINPLDGQQGQTKGGNGTTMRGDGNVAAFRFCMAEFDNLSIIDQIRFWSVVKLPIMALVHSGGKSIHAWIDIWNMRDVLTSDEWNREIRLGLYEKYLIPLGVDRACSNPARLARMPGHFRTEKNEYQRLLWLSPDGRTIT